jgi:adenosylhomocysteine nucleosidase
VAAETFLNGLRAMTRLLPTNGEAVPPVLRPLLLGLVLALVICAAGCQRPGATASQSAGGTVVLVSANAEWKVVTALFPRARIERTPWGESFETELRVAGEPRRVRFAHGGWGKVAAAASTQYVIDHWKPALVVNLGTCGGFAGRIERFAVILVDRTVIYDIKEAMGDSAGAIADYATTIDLAWLGPRYPGAVRKTLLVSADRDLVPAEISELEAKYGAVAGDWESGAIAWVCARNGQRLLILRGVSDLVSTSGGEAYGSMQTFEAGTKRVMTSLVEQLPGWLAQSR